jgi:hypothetical protein
MIAKNFTISAHGQRFHQPRCFAPGLVVVFFLLAVGFCQAADTPSLPAATHPAPVAQNLPNSLKLTNVLRPLRRPPRRPEDVGSVSVPTGETEKLMDVPLNAHEIGHAK